MQQDTVTITLTKNEALVLHDYLSKFNEQTNAEDFEHNSDQIVLWNLEAILEANLPEVFHLNYLEIIDKARATFNTK